MSSRNQPIINIIMAFLYLILIQILMAQNPNAKSPIHISLVKPNFATITNELHEENRIGYRFHEHEPISYGRVPLSNKQANIDIARINQIETEYQNSENIFIYKHEIEKSEHWSKQDWSYYMKPVQDGIEIVLIIETFSEGLPEYYGIQQCFRMSGKTNKEWRKKIANTPAFSEYDLWNNPSANADKKSLTYVLGNNKWQVIPANEKTNGARTPLGMAIDYLRTNNNPMKEVGPYKATMLNPVDNGLITRTNVSDSWVCGIRWQNTSHVTNHHPADCLHSIVNIGNIPPFSRRAIVGKIYWFEGNKDSLYNHHKNDFLGGTINNKLVVASCQFPVSRDIKLNANWIKDQMRVAKIRGAELVHFPECALSGYGGDDVMDFTTYDWDLLRSQTGLIVSLAKDLKLWTILGSSHRLIGNHKPHNSLYLINPRGEVVDRYDKRFCTNGDLKYYTPGDHFVKFGVNNVKCGLLICYDIRFPELYREYSKMGVDIVFQSFYNARHEEDCIHPKIMPVTAQARAASNSFYISLTNSSAPYSWPCYFITPDGLIENKSPANQANVLISTIDLSKKFYDASEPFRMDAINGKLNSGDVIKDPRSIDRKSY